MQDFEYIFDEEEPYDDEFAYEAGFSAGYKAGQQWAYRLYSHRNGQAIAPDVEGWYWVEMQLDMMMPVTFWVMREWYENAWTDKDTYPLAIYGPIPTPTQGAEGGELP